MDHNLKIVSFCCNYCAYAAADLAGISRMQYPATVRIIRVPCSGRVGVIHIMRAFEAGADGVFIAGCLKGGCHFVEGNLHAEKRVMLAKKILEEVGIGGERLEMFFISSAMAPEFVEAVKLMTDRIAKLGPALPDSLKLTERSEGDTKRVLLYKILKNIALKIPAKPIPIPEGLDEFGTLCYDLSSCIGCRKCEEACPEEAVEFVGELDLAAAFKSLKGRGEGKKRTKRRLLYETLSNLALKEPSKLIPVPEALREFWNLSFNPLRCAVCEKCSDICPEGSLDIIGELDLPRILSFGREKT